VESIDHPANFQLGKRIALINRQNAGVIKDVSVAKFVSTADYNGIIYRRPAERNLG